MGTYVNPGNNSFLSAVRSDIYIDKTGMLEILNNNINKESRYFAVSRARRFGKSMAAGMIDAYYSCGCDSRELFAPYEIAKYPDFEEHLNKYNVLHFDTSTFLNAAKTPDEVIPMMDNAIMDSLKEEFPFLSEEEYANAAAAILKVYNKEGKQFIIIIDEWECIIRDAKDNEKLILDYLKYLRGFFKTEESKQFLALGYITGILPIKKIKGESALNNFWEYTMIAPGAFMSFFGFTETEIEELCMRYSQTIDNVRNWYDGYLMPVAGDWDDHEQMHIYNPSSVVEAFHRRKFGSYWKNTGAFTGVNDYIELNKAGLKDDVIAMIAGERRPVNVSTFQNDLTHYKTKDDVLTALIHMGYLGYDTESGEAFIPNEEVRDVFESAVRVGD